MQIRLLDKPNEEIIAIDDLGGEFFLGSESAVFYRNPDDATTWFVNLDEKVFRSCVSAYTRYCQNVQKAANEELIVQDFERELSNAKALRHSPPSYWSFILEQCAAGLL